MKKIKRLADKNIISNEVANKLTDYNLRLNSNNIPVIYNLSHIRKIFKIRKKDQESFFGNSRDSLYQKFYIKKKSGGYRAIESPCDKLLFIQKYIKEEILSKFKVSEYAKGFKENTNIFDNAVLHTNKELVINIDLKDFFPSINYEKVFRIFNYYGYTKEVSHLLTKLCTNNTNVLPQGAPTSPIISNIVCLKLDKRLSALAKSIGCDYSRYADDMTFSGNYTAKYSLDFIKKIIIDEGFIINDDKLRLQYKFQRQEVTGLTVNTKVSVSKKLIRELDNAIYFCMKYGIVDHMEKNKCDKTFYKEHLYGIAYFVKMIDRGKGMHYLEQLNQIKWLY